MAAALIQNLRMPAALAVVEVHRLLGDVAGTTLPGSFLVVEKKHPVSRSSVAEGT